ncbi:YraN family protein [Flocculibacter collagenilyticus]|uniref:YraN family protein n=1 Tax=Flocculibacter collagenilyticus TaxID=2744479 RepID=UPI001F41F6CE|nr:YraN family protein [Flocculibacter collagenilyticus]
MKPLTKLFSASTKHKGDYYESLALNHLKKHGYRLIEANYNTRFGEIDLIVKNDDSLVFVEVRYRKNDHHGSAAESVTPSKQKKIIKTAQHFLTQFNLTDTACRFDVIAFSGDNSQPLQWHQNAF